MHFIIFGQGILGTNFTLAGVPPRRFDILVLSLDRALGMIDIGDRVIIDGERYGTLRYLGTAQFKEGLWAGVELDTQSGRNDGSVNGIRYFTCASNFGVFVHPSKLEKLEGLGGSAAAKLPAETPARQTAGTGHSGSLPFKTPVTVQSFEESPSQAKRPAQDVKYPQTDSIFAAIENPTVQASRSATSHTAPPSTTPKATCDALPASTPATGVGPEHDISAQFQEWQDDNQRIVEMQSELQSWRAQKLASSITPAAISNESTITLYQFFDKIDWYLKEQAKRNARYERSLKKMQLKSITTSNGSSKPDDIKRLRAELMEEKDRRVEAEEGRAAMEGRAIDLQRQLEFHMKSGSSMNGERSQLERELDEELRKRSALAQELGRMKLGKIEFDQLLIEHERLQKTLKEHVEKSEADLSRTIGERDEAILNLRLVQEEIDRIKADELSQIVSITTELEILRAETNATITALSVSLQEEQEKTALKDEALHLLSKQFSKEKADLERRLEEQWSHGKAQPFFEDRLAKAKASEEQQAAQLAQRDEIIRQLTARLEDTKSIQVPTIEIQSPSIRTTSGVAELLQSPSPGDEDEIGRLVKRQEALVLEFDGLRKQYATSKDRLRTVKKEYGELFKAKQLSEAYFTKELEKARQDSEKNLEPGSNKFKEECATQKERLDKLEADLENSMNEKAELERRLEDLLARPSELSQEQSSELLLLKDSKVRHEYEIAELENKLESQKSQSEKSIQSLSMAIDCLTCEKADLERLLHNRESTVAEEQLHELSMLKESKRRLESENAEIKTSMERQTSWANETNAELLAKIDRLKSEKNSLESRNKELQLKIDGQIPETDQISGNLLAMIEDLKTKKAAVEAQLESSEANYLELKLKSEQAMSSLQADQLANENDMEELKTRCAHFEASAVGKLAEIVALKEQINAAENARWAAEDKLENVQRHLDHATARLEQLLQHNERADLQSSQASPNTDGTAANALVESLQAEKLELKSKITSLDDRFDSMEQQAEVRESIIREYAEQIEMQTAYVRKLGEELRQATIKHRQELEDLKAAHQLELLATADSHRKALEMAHEQADEQVRTIHAELNPEDSDVIANLRHELTRITKSYEGLKADSEQRLRLAHEEGEMALQRTKTQLQKAMAEVQERDQQIRIQEDELLEWSGKLEKKRHDYQKEVVATEELEDARKLIAELRHSIEEETKANARLERKINSLEATIAELQEEPARLNKTAAATSISLHADLQGMSLEELQHYKHSLMKDLENIQPSLQTPSSFKPSPKSALRPDSGLGLQSLAEATQRYERLKQRFGKLRTVKESLIHLLREGNLSGSIQTKGLHTSTRFEDESESNSSIQSLDILVEDLPCAICNETGHETLDCDAALDDPMRLSVLRFSASDPALS